MHRPSMVPLPFLLTLLATLADAQQHGRFDGGNRSAGTGAFPSPLFEGRTASGNAGGPPPPRRPPSFSPFTPFLSPQSLPRPLSAGRMPRRRLDVEDGRRTSSANNSLEGGGTGRAENGGERWRGGRGMNEQRQRVVDASSPSGPVGLSRMATTTSTNSSSSSLAAGGDPTVPFPLPPKGPFDGGAARKEGRAELLVEKEGKTDLERVKKDGDDEGQGRKRGGEQFPPDDGVLKKSAEEERFRTPPQSVPPLAGRFAPTRTTAGGGMGMKAADDRTSDEFKNDEHGVRGGGGKGGERSEERAVNRGRIAEMEIGGPGERENSAEWRRGGARGGGGAIGGNGGGRNREDGEEEEGVREEGEGRSRNGKGGGGRKAESLLFSPLQGPFPDSPGGRSATIGRDGRRGDRRGEEVEERRSGEGMGDRRGERRGDGQEGRGRAADERRRKASSSELEDRRRPLAGPRHVPPPPAHHSHRTPPSSSSSAEERTSRESADGRPQHPHNAQRRPAGIPSRTARPPVAAVTLGFQRGIPNPNEFFPDKIRSAYPPFPKPFEEFDGKQRSGGGGDGREGGGGEDGREGGGDGREGGRGGGDGRGDGREGGREGGGGRGGGEGRGGEGRGGGREGGGGEGRGGGGDGRGDGREGGGGRGGGDGREGGGREDKIK